MSICSYSIGVRVMSYQPMDDELVEKVTNTFKALSDPTRMKILHLLFHQEQAVSEIAETLQMQQSTISHQLQYLRQIQLVKSRREKTRRYYSLDDYHVINLLEQAIEHSKHTHE